jgi:hypothetical protein
MSCRFAAIKSNFLPFFVRKIERKKNFTTLKANSNLKQSKNKIRMLKEIKMLHNNVTKEMREVRGSFEEH